MTKRKFAVVSEYQNAGLRLPQRQTGASAGYDLAAAEDVLIAPKKILAVPTGIKVYMKEDEVLLLYIRSGLALKQGLCLANGVGVIDADYADNPDNEGHIRLAILNTSNQAVEIKKGTRIAQGIFFKYLLADDDDFGGQKRGGGFGSTGATLE